MVHHPRLGADYLTSMAGGSSRYELGWNRVPLGAVSSRAELFIFVSPEKGVTTPNRPAISDSEIHDVDARYPEIHASRAWTEARALADEVVAANLREWPAERVRQVMDSIELAGGSDGVTHDTAALADWMRSAVPRMADAMRAGNLHLFLAPALDVVRAYLAFELPGMLARELLAVLLSVQLNIPHLGPPTTTPPAARATALEHLADQAYRIQKLRSDKQVGAYFELTYLLNLYGATCAVLAGHAAQTAPDQRVAKLGLNAEEIAAHHGVPTFSLPAMLTPTEIVDWLSESASERDQPAPELARFYGVYPPLEAALAGSKPQDVNANYRAFSRKQEPYDVLAALEGELTPVAPANQEEVMRGLLAMMLGREMRPPEA